MYHQNVPNYYASLMSSAMSSVTIINVTISFVINLSLWSLSACVPARYILSILGSVAMAIIYGLKVNLSVAMVAMVNHTAVRLQNPHGADDHSTTLSINSSVSLREECEADGNSTGGANQVS